MDRACRKRMSTREEGIAKRVLASIRAAARAGQPAPTNEALANEGKVPERSISRVLSRLSHQGRVSIERRGIQRRFTIGSHTTDWTATGRGCRERPARVKRGCMRCGAPFLSEGIHHRLCLECRRTAPLDDHRYAI